MVVLHGQALRGCTRPVCPTPSPPGLRWRPARPAPKPPPPFAWRSPGSPATDVTGRYLEPPALAGLTRDGPASCGPSGDKPGDQRPDGGRYDGSHRRDDRP